MHSEPLKHEKQKLIFYVAQDLDHYVRSKVQQFVNEVAVSRIWSMAPPTFRTWSEIVNNILGKVYQDMNYGRR